VKAWPFVQIGKLDKPHSCAVNCLVTLPDLLFASCGGSEVKIWHYDKKSVRRFDAQEDIYDLKYLGDSKLLFRCIDKAFIYDLKVASTVSIININGHVLCSSVTRDRRFLMLVKHSSLLCYHIKGSYFYHEFDLLDFNRHRDVFSNIFKVTDSLVFGVAKNGVYEIFNFRD